MLLQVLCTLLIAHTQIVGVHQVSSAPEIRNRLFDNLKKAQTLSFKAHFLVNGARKLNQECKLLRNEKGVVLIWVKETPSDGSEPSERLDDGTFQYHYSGRIQNHGFPRKEGFLFHGGIGANPLVMFDKSSPIFDPDPKLDADQAPYELDAVGSHEIKPEKSGDFNGASYCLQFVLKPQAASDVGNKPFVRIYLTVDAKQIGVKALERSDEPMPNFLSRVLVFDSFILNDPNVKPEMFVAR